jgi:dTDP-4-dehydrorhamnose 3,5-epimerase
MLIEPKVFGDARGFFWKASTSRLSTATGTNFEFVQDNHSRSSKGVLRGLHYQLPPCPGQAGARGAWRCVMWPWTSAAVCDLWPMGGRGVDGDSHKQFWIPPVLPMALWCSVNGRLSLQDHGLLRARVGSGHCLE